MIYKQKECGLLTSSHIFSRIGIQDVARWQFCSTTQSPTSIAYRESIINQSINQSINLLFLLNHSCLKTVTKFNEIINSKVGVLAACPQCHINGSLHINIWAQSTLSSSLLCLTDLLPEKHSQTQTRDTRTSDRTL